MTFLSYLAEKCRTLSTPSLLSPLVRLCPEHTPEHCQAALSTAPPRSCRAGRGSSHPSAQQSVGTHGVPRVVTDVMAVLLSKMTQSVLTGWLGRPRMDGFGLINAIITYIQTGMAQTLIYQEKKNQTEDQKEMEGIHLEQFFFKMVF